MSRLVYKVRSSKNDLPLSAEQLAERYFFGITLTDQSNNQMTNQSIEFYIKAAIKSIEGHLNIKLKKQIIEESLSYNLNDYKSWGFLPTSYPVLQPHSLQGFLGKIEQVNFPTEWLSAKKSNDPTSAHRAIYIIPTVGNTNHNSVVYSGITPHMGWFGRKTIPNYWTVKYCTSFDIVPEDILDFVGKLAAINIFHQLGDIILGAGIASQSVGLDGLSQSISTTSSATNAGYGARVTGYIDDLKRMKVDLKNKYDGISLMSM